jgi:hypothetical protein
VGDAVHPHEKVFIRPVVWWGVGARGWQPPSPAPSMVADMTQLFWVCAMGERASVPQEGPWAYRTPIIKLWGCGACRYVQRGADGLCSGPEGSLTPVDAATVDDGPTLERGEPGEW